MMNSQVNIGDKLKIKVGADYSWSRVKSIDTKTYTIPIYSCEILEGKYAGEMVAACGYVDSALEGQFISHEFPKEVNS